MPTLRERFWSKVAIGGPDECWEWTAGLKDKKKGYGGFTVKGRREDRAHRAAFQLWIGPIPAGLFVLHRCDNPPCCNPAHLFLGTNADNMADMAAKGRANRPHGDSNGRAVVGWPEVKTIRSRRGQEPQRVTADRLGITQSQVSKIQLGSCWR